MCIRDRYNFWQYTPSAEVADISQRADFSEKGKFYLYTSHAIIDNAQDFNNNCQRKEQKNAILGCYSTSRIYIYDVNYAELDGIKEVTAAHEMLHAVWDRQSSDEQARLCLLYTSPSPRDR